MNISLNNYAATIDEDSILRDSNNRCSSQCSFKYDYKPVSSSLKGCVDQSGNNFIGIPAIELSSQSLSETSEKYSVILDNTKYWVKSVYITNTDDNLFVYKNSLDKSTASDPSLCSFMIVHNDEYSNNYLVVYIPVSIETSDSRDPRGGMVNSIISAMTDISQCTYPDTSSHISVTGGLNLNAFIPNNKYYYFKSTVNNNQNQNLHFIAFSGMVPIYLPTNTQLNSIIGTETKVNPTTRNRPLNLLVKPFQSTNQPMNSLSGDEEEIYIQCQPTDAEGELLEFNVPKIPLNTENAFSFNFLDADGNKAIHENWFIASVTGIIIMIILMKGAEFLFKSGTKTFLDKL